MLSLGSAGVTKLVSQQLFTTFRGKDANLVIRVVEAEVTILAQEDAVVFLPRRLSSHLQGLEPAQRCQEVKPWSGSTSLGSWCLVSFSSELWLQSSSVSMLVLQTGEHKKSLTVFCR